MRDIVVTLVEGSLPSTSIAPLEIFACAGVVWDSFHGRSSKPLFRVHAATANGRPTRNLIPVKIVPSRSIAAIRKADLIVVPAAGADIEEVVRRNWPLIPWLRRWHERGAAVAGICTGVALLAQAGLLDGRPATTHWAFAEQFRKFFPRVDWQPERFITESGNVFCSGGVYSAIDLSLYMVEKFCGHTIAMETARALLLETPRMWQSTYAADAPGKTHDDVPIQKAQQWLFQNFRDDGNVERLASRVGMSPRNFARRFKAATGETPLSYLHRTRINAARHLLESETLSVHDVSLAVGYEDMIFFRRLFKRYAGVAPREYRMEFGISPAA